MQSYFGYAIWGLRAGTNHFLLKKNLETEVENALTGIRSMAQNHDEGNDYLYMVDRTNNFNVLSIINTKTIDMDKRNAYIVVSIIYKINTSLNTCAIPYLQKAMEFYLRMQTVSKAENMFSDEMFIEQFQGLNLVASNLYHNYHTPKQGYIRFNNINEIQDYFTYKSIPIKFNRVLFLKEGNTIANLNYEEINPYSTSELAPPAPTWPPISDPQIIADPLPPNFWAKKIGIILISITIIGTSLFFINKYKGNKPKDLTTIDTAAKVNTAIEVDSPKADILPPIDTKPPIAGRRYHIVDDGETFSSIAREFKLNDKDLKKINPQIKNFDKLKKGNTIWLEELNSVKKDETTSGINPPPPASNSNKEICKKYFQDMENKKREIKEETDEDILKNLNSEKDNIQEKITSCNCK